MGVCLFVRSFVCWFDSSIHQIDEDYYYWYALQRWYPVVPPPPLRKKGQLGKKMFATFDTIEQRQKKNKTKQIHYWLLWQALCGQFCIVHTKMSENEFKWMKNDLFVCLVSIKKYDFFFILKFDMIFFTLCLCVCVWL